MIFTKESLERLRQQTNLVELVSSYVELKRSGRSYKGCCPFHEEKTPSFMIQSGEHHYHCFGCGAHGDAIQFLMSHQRLSFSEAVELLAQRFHVALETVDSKQETTGPSKKAVREVLEEATVFYQFCLLHSEEGHEALRYLYSRGIPLDWIIKFRIGLSPSADHLLSKWLREKGFGKDLAVAAGLVSEKSGKMRDFFSGRIMFPIENAQKSTVGFSARKWKPASFGGKYINSPETVVFKKSRLLFGLPYSKKRISKEKSVLIVEGQIDTIRLVENGFDFAVAAQGTAFGEDHLKELIPLGINKAFLAFDADKAGLEAAQKIGHLFQREGIEVRVVALPEGEDPDSLLLKQGPSSFRTLLENAEDYLSFLVRYTSLRVPPTTPAAKNEVILTITRQVNTWNHPVMVYETLRRLARILHVPEEYVGLGEKPAPNPYTKSLSRFGGIEVDANKILETDLLRWLLLFGRENSSLVEFVQQHLSPEDFWVNVCKKIFFKYLENHRQQVPCDLLSLAIDLDDAEAQFLISDLVHKKVKKEKVEVQLKQTVQKILERNWMEKREEIRRKLQQESISEQETLSLLKLFDELNKSPPSVTK